MKNNNKKLTPYERLTLRQLISNLRAHLAHAASYRQAANAVQSEIQTFIYDMANERSLDPKEWQVSADLSHFQPIPAAVPPAAQEATAKPGPQLVPDAVPEKQAEVSVN
jgi:hypothetical protein